MKIVRVFAVFLFIFCCAAKDNDSLLKKEGEVYEKAPKVYVCRSKEQVDWITSLITSHVFTGKISMWEALGVNNAKFEEQPAKMQAILRREGLPLIPPCIEATEAATEASVVKTTIGNDLKINSDVELFCSDLEYRRLAVEEVYESINKNKIEKSEKLENILDSFIENTNVTIVLFKESLKQFNLTLNKKCTLTEGNSTGVNNTIIKQSDKLNELEIKNETSTAKSPVESTEKFSENEVKSEKSSENEVKSETSASKNKPFDPTSLNMTKEEMEEVFIFTIINL